MTSILFAVYGRSQLCILKSGPESKGIGGLVKITTRSQLEIGNFPPLDGRKSEIFPDRIRHEINARTKRSANALHVVIPVNSHGIRGNLGRVPSFLVTCEVVAWISSHSKESLPIRFDFSWFPIKVFKVLKQHFRPDVHQGISFFLRFSSFLRVDGNGIDAGVTIGANIWSQDLDYEFEFEQQEEDSELEGKP
ncbi:hypothetical protein Tco_0363882 [Tanacetum coccineum]